jgi:hypothetical protein
MWFHFDFANYFKMIRLAWGERIPQVRIYFLAVLLLWVPLVAAFHAVCFFLDGIFFPGLWRTSIRQPIFVLGHARSGTTHVHRLLMRDEGRFSSFLFYEMFFPSLMQKKAIRLFARFDRQQLGGAVEKRVRAWEARHYAAVRKVHEMGLTEHEEDDIVLYYSCASGYWISKMPYMGDLDFYSVDQWPQRKRRRLMRFYKECVRRQLYLNGDDKIHLSKNPIFAGRVESLLETFPDARIVVPVRNPEETIPSLLKLVSGGWRRLRWDPDRVRRCQRVLAEQSFHTYRHPLEVIARRPGTPSAVIDYRELVEDPAGVVRRLYGELGIPMTAAFEAVLTEESARARKHVSGHSYSLEEFGLDVGVIRTELSDLYDRFGWPGGDKAAIGTPDDGDSAAGGAQ